MDAEKIGATLAKARVERSRLRKHPSNEVFDLREAIRIQDAMIRAMPATVVGWKVGATSRIVQKKIGVTEPFAGPLFSTDICEDGCVVPVAKEDLKIVEAEIGLQLGSSLSPQKQAYERTDIVSSIQAVHPVFEIVNKRLPGDLTESAEWLVADGAVNHALVRGEGIDYDQGMDLASEKVSVSVNGTISSIGIGSNAMGDPIDVAVWLINHLSARGIGMKSGDIIATGLVCDLLTGEPGDRFSAVFGSIGSVEMKLSEHKS